MSVSGGPDIVENGLVLYLDAANRRSYSGSGTAWFDISGNGKNGTLFNGVGYATNNGGTLTFDGTNDVVELGAGTNFWPLPQFTIDVWFRSLGTVPTTGTGPSLYGFTFGIRVNVNETTLGFGVDNGTDVNQTQTLGSIPFRNGTWYNSVMTHTGTVNSMYINGQLNRSINRTWSGETRWPTNFWNIGRDNNNSFQFFYGDIPQCKVYNRVLSDAEILQNFNATRSRFGV
jgi:hypothetical protein